MLNRGWAPLVGRARRSRKVHRSANPRAIRPRDRSRGGDEPGGPYAGTGPDAGGESAAFKAPAPGQRIAESPDAAARLRSLGYLSGSTPAKARYTTRRRSEAPRGTRSDDSRCGRGVRRRPFRRCGAALSRGHRAPSRHGDRVQTPRVRGGAARQRRRARSTCSSRRSRKGVTDVRLDRAAGRDARRRGPPRAGYSAARAARP